MLNPAQSRQQFGTIGMGIESIPSGLPQLRHANCSVKINYYLCNVTKRYMSMKFNIELPFFPGFYESDLETSDTSYWAIKEELEYYQNDAYDNPDERAIYEQLTEDDLEFDYQGYEEEVR